MTLPTLLRQEGFKFCRIKKGTKKPFENEWTTRCYSFDEIEKYLPSENYGVICGYNNLAVIDCDNEAFKTAVELLLPETFRVKTPSGGLHSYYFIPELKQKIVLNMDNGGEKIHLGEVQSHGTQVVGVGSIHPNGGTYEALNNLPIATLSTEVLYDFLKPFMQTEYKETEQLQTEEKQQASNIDSLSVTDIWGLGGLKQHGNEYYGVHPVHGSTNGMNFWINPNKNTWHCFRCNSGGGALSAIAVKEGIIDCSEARPGNLRGDKAKQAITVAKEKYGLQDNFRPNNPLTPLASSLRDYVTEPISVVWSNELKNLEIKEKDWIIEKFLPMKSVCILTGKRGTMKTFVSLLMCASIASGEDFLTKYQAEKGKVLYLDKENGLEIIKGRWGMLMKGMKKHDDAPEINDVGFICFSQLKMDRPNDVSAIEELIKEHKPKLLVIDTYRRAVSFDENDAGEVSRLFVDTLRPLVEKYDFSILLIHHNRKGASNHKDDTEIDEMDELRGSSDLANYADSILKLEKEGDKVLLLKQLKNRNAQEEKPIKINVEFKEDSVILCNGGEFMPQSSADRCIEMMIVWFSENNIKTFQTKDAQAFAFKKGIKETNFKYALQELQSRGIIERTTRGCYDVKL